MENDFSTDPFFNDELQQINDGTLQTHIDQLDPSAVGIGVAPADALPANPDVLHRLLALHRNGCSSPLSWSRQGHIASISRDGTHIDLQYLIFDRRKRSWVLSAKRVEHVGLGPLVSLAWSPMASDLAVVDSSGRVSVLRPVGTTANRLSEIRAGSADDSHPLGQVIGVHWLSQDRAERPKQVVQFTSKPPDSDKWAHHHVKALPLQPLYQRAIVLVTQNAHFSVIYEKLDGSFAKSSCPLVSNTDKVCTHAAFAPTLGGKLLVSLHACDGTISAYLVSIDFAPVKSDSPPILTAELAVSRLPSPSTVAPALSMFTTATQYLTHLGIIPTSEVEKSARLPPTVYAIYANINDEAPSSSGTQLSTGVVRRWTLAPVDQVLPAKLNDMPDKSKPGAATEVTQVMSVDCYNDKDEQAITNATLIENSQGLYITSADGRSDLLSTEDLTSLALPSTDGSVASLAQAGFALPLLPHPSIATLSPNQACAVVLTPTHSTELSISQYFPPDQSQSLDPSFPAGDAANAMVVLAFARSCWTNSNIDDLLSMVMHTFPAAMAYPLIVSLYQTLFRETEFMHEKDQRSELEKVVQKPVLTKVFSFHYGIGFLATKDPLTNLPSTSTPMPLSSQWVWIAANLRFVAQLLYISIREVQPPASASPSTELIEMVCGNIKWTLDLIRWIAATVIETSDRETNPDFFDPLKHPDQQSSDGSQGLVALLLNCHWSRQFFIAIVRAMRVLCKLPEPRSAPQTEIIRTIMQWSSGRGLNLIAVEALLDPRWSGWADNELENDMQKISARQVRMMATGRVEGGYEGTVRRIATKLYNAGGNMREKRAVDRLKLWQSKVSLGWILLDDGWEGEGPDATPPAERKVYDVHKKKVITAGVKELKTAAGTGAGADELMIKRCVRCGRHNEDVNGMGKEFPRHVAGLMMRCVCDGPWIVEPWAAAVQG